MTEQEDYVFLRSKIANFQRLGIRTHAYIQGFNLVTTEWKDIDPWCKDPWGRRIPYSKGRSFTCPNNTAAEHILLSRVERACQEPVDGIFIDNVVFGMPPLMMYDNFAPFFGCACSFCQKAFAAQFGYPLPPAEKSGQAIHDYLDFRWKTIDKVLGRVQQLCMKYHKEFGINLYDPTLRTDVLYYGFDTKKVLQRVSYVLLENHSLASQHMTSNEHLSPLISQAQKPIFVVSYKKGIGQESQYTQKDIDAVFSDAKKHHFSPCLKVTEFTTRGTWHMLHTSRLEPPRSFLIPATASPVAQSPKKISTLKRRIVRRSQKTIVSAFHVINGHPLIASILTKSPLYTQQIKKPRLLHL